MTDALTITARPLPLTDNGGGCACCRPDLTPFERETGMSSEQTTPAQTTVLEVEGMTCGHCVGRVIDALNVLEGVQDVQVRLVPAGASTVTVDADRPISPATVRTAVEKAGYTVSGSWLPPEGYAH